MLFVVWIGECKLFNPGKYLFIVVNKCYYLLIVSRFQSEVANIDAILISIHSLIKLSAKRADGLARRWQNQEETFVYEQTGGPDVDDVTDFYVQDYKFGRTMNVLNQRIILRLNDSIKDCDNLASFGALGHRDEVSLFGARYTKDLIVYVNMEAFAYPQYGKIFPFYPRQ